MVCGEARKIKMKNTKIFQFEAFTFMELLVAIIILGTMIT